MKYVKEWQSSTFLVADTQLYTRLCPPRQVFIFCKPSKRQKFWFRHRFSCLRVLLAKDNRVTKGPLGRSLCSFARTTHSAHSLNSVLLCYACLLGSGARSLTTLTPSWESWKSQICAYAVNVFNGNKRVFWSSLETRPELLTFFTLFKRCKMV